MKTNTKIFLWSIAIGILIGFAIENINVSNTPDYEKLEVKKSNINNVDTIKFIPFEFSQESVYNMICLAGIKHPEIVLKQSICETGHFKSKVLKERNNLFGFHNGKEYLKFNTLYESCIFYRKWQQKHYNGGDYYQFLDDFGYASDSCYTDVLKRIRINV